jgi:hypothetical protein
MDISELYLDVAFKRFLRARHWSAAFALRRLSGLVTRSPATAGDRCDRPAVRKTMAGKATIYRWGMGMIIIYR